MKLGSAVSASLVPNVGFIGVYVDVNLFGFLLFLCPFNFELLFKLSNFFQTYRFLEILVSPLIFNLFYFCQNQKS